MKVQFKKVVITALAVLAVGCARAENPTPAGQPAIVLATVDGVQITLPKFKERLKTLKEGFDNASGSGPSEEAKIDLLSQMIQEEMYLREARRLNITVAPSEVEDRIRKITSGYGQSLDGTLKQEGITPAQYREEAARDIIIEKLLSSQVYSKVMVTKEQAADYCKKNKKRLWKEKRVRVRQIAVGTAAEARELLDLLKKGSDFAELAKKRSISPDAVYGGDLGWVEKGQMPPKFESAIWRLKKGAISGIIHTSYGYQIFKAEAAENAGPLSPTEAEAAAVRELSKTMGEERFQKWQDALKARSKVQINYSLLRGI